MEHLMYDNSEEIYREATRYAQINIDAEAKLKSNRRAVLSTFLICTLGYFSFNYVQNGENGVNFFSSTKTAVLGVSTTADEVKESDASFLKVLDATEVDLLKEQSQSSLPVSQQSLEHLNDSMKVLVSETNIQSASSYTKAISRELEGYKERVIVVRSGDTLSSLAQEYYGDALAYDKIIKSNPHLKDSSSKLYAGEHIKLPY
jgi:LysM repeat protein